MATKNQKNYSVEIVSTSRTLSAKERVMLKDTTNALSLDEQTQPTVIAGSEGQAGTVSPNTVVLVPAYWAELAVHNEKAQDKDYKKYIVVDTEGHKYVTGSESFWRAFIDIMEEMAECDEDFSIEVYRLPSKNYKGKEFLTCSVV